MLTSFTAASSLSDQQLRGSQMKVDIVASVPRLEKTASLQGFRTVSSGGAISYDSIQLTGDESVRHQIIARYLAAEVNAGHEHDLRLLALTPDNYRFQYRSLDELDGHKAWVFDVKPRHKREGSFRGQIWIDAQTYLPLRESGRIEQHSMFLRRLTLVRRFRIIDQMAVPESTDLDIDTRLVGKAQMKVKLQNVSFPYRAGNVPPAPAVQ